MATASHKEDTIEEYNELARLPCFWKATGFVEGNAVQQA